jgi:hypothetical protein
MFKLAMHSLRYHVEELEEEGRIDNVVQGVAETQASASDMDEMMESLMDKHNLHQCPHPSPGFSICYLSRSVRRTSSDSIAWSG